MPVISVYLNEQSAVGQFNGHPWQEGLDELLDCLDLIRGLKEADGYYSSEIYTRPFLYDKTYFATVLKRDKDLNIKFRHIIEDFSRLSQGDCERKFSGDKDSILLNFQFGPYPDDANKRIFSSSALLLSYLKSKGLISPTYDYTSSIPPRDDETILVDRTIFTVTQHSFQRRKMYKRVGTSELWYVDNLHYGRDAHLEVFNETTKKQKAVSHIEKIDFFRNLTNAEKERVLLFDKGK